MKAQAITLAMALLSCARTVPQVKDGPQIAQGEEVARPRAAADTEGSSCPLAVPGASVAFAPVSGGGSVLFSAAQDAELQEVRERVRALAESHNHSANRLAMTELPYRAEMVPIPGGARLDLVTPVGNDTLELQRSVQNEVRWVQEGRCRDDRSR